MWSGFWNSSRFIYIVHLTIKRIFMVYPEVLRGSPKFSGVLRGSLSPYGPEGVPSAPQARPGCLWRHLPSLCRSSERRVATSGCRPGAACSIKMYWISNGKSFIFENGVSQRRSQIFSGFSQTKAKCTTSINPKTPGARLLGAGHSLGPVRAQGTSENPREPQRTSGYTINIFLWSGEL